MATVTGEAEGRALGVSVQPTCLSRADRLDFRGPSCYQSALPAGYEFSTVMVFKPNPSDPLEDKHKNPVKPHVPVLGEEGTQLPRAGLWAGAFPPAACGGRCHPLSRLRRRACPLGCKCWSSDTGLRNPELVITPPPDCPQRRPLCGLENWGGSMGGGCPRLCMSCIWKSKGQMPTT